MAPLPSSTPIIVTTTEMPKVLTAISDRTDKFFKSVSSIACEHPFVKSLLFFRSQFDSFFQVHFKIPRVPQSNFLSTQNFAAILPSDSVAGLVVSNGINNFLNLYNTILVVRLVLTWFPNTPPAIVSPLSTICDPYLNIFRGIIPPLGGTLDLSPILAFLVLNALTSSAAALPAELPPSQHLTTTQQKWMRRLSSKSSSTN